MLTFLPNSPLLMAFQFKIVKHIVLAVYLNALHGIFRLKVDYVMTCVTFVKKNYLFYIRDKGLAF